MGDILRRNTRQRQAILEVLRGMTSHPTAAELYNAVRKRLPRISLGTVYRNLEVLARLGLLRKLEFGGTETRFDGDLQEHYHVRCVECGRVADLHDLPFDPSDLRVEGLGGYRILGHHLEYVGVCPACGTRMRSDGSSRSAAPGDSADQMVE
jgi:Fur family ferric uptake transcriptional regulator